MLRRRLYYTLKPYLPWQIRTAFRRAVASRKRVASRAIWPIQPGASRAPAGWPGWPEGKKFALVLTHDVEGPEGLAKCRQLAVLESALGFRSAFNLIPEGPYKVPLELRNWISKKGFEVGVHDLRHDGRLYSSREAFRKNAQSINGYLKDWGVGGFRSGFMLHELDWIHDLEIKYDCSTFDTDPFEPQPDGTGTIFPFWVDPPAGTSRPGYVELPYTLPQDSTLFLILRESSPEIWLRKLDWVAEHGGMVLVNVHPDYLRFEGERASSTTFPVSHYRELLEHVRRRYAQSFWQPLPRELAAWYERAARPGRAAAAAPATAEARSPGRKDSPLRIKPASLRGKRAAVLLYSYYPSDSRPRRAAQAMIGAGMTVELLCLSEYPDEPRSEQVDGVNVFRLPMARNRRSKFTYVSNYLSFFFKSFLWLLRRGFPRRYDLVHVHNMPDFLVFATLLEKARGSTVILDLHDPMPELMMSIYRLSPKDWQTRFLRSLERRSIRFADLVLTPNLAFRDLFNSRGCPPGRMQIIMNSPEAVFNPSLYPGAEKRDRSDGTFRIMHHGSIVHRHGLSLMIEAAAKIHPAIPGLQVDIYGAREPHLDIILERARELGIAAIVHYHGNKNAEEIARAILDTDLGVIPNRRSAFTEINFPTRIFEYLSMGRLVVVPATRGISDYFGPEDLPMYEQNNVDELANRILWVFEQPAAAQAMLERGCALYRRHLWEEEEARFLNLVATAASAR